MKEHCKETLQRAYLILDGEDISHQERVEIETHLHECGPCYERYGIEIEVKRVITRIRGCSSSTCPDTLKQRITQLLDEA
jgi:mycothiol system anti-sigma-R factor